MSIKLHLGNRLDILANILADDISTYYRLKDILFDSPIILVPNMNYAKWLKITIAKKLSICMNFDFQYLENGLLTILKMLDDKQHQCKYEFLDTSIVELILLSILIDVNSCRCEFLPIYNYLLGRSKIEEAAFEIKTWQLCKKLALLFKKYEHDRPDMIRSWRNGNKIIGEKEIERCQRKLYLKIFRIRNSFFGKVGIKFFSLYDHYYDFLDRKKDIYTKDQNENKKIYLFGFSRFPSLHFKIIDLLKQKLDISIYSINPSQEYWGDVKIPWMNKKLNSRGDITKRKINIVKNYDLFGEIDNELLALWGKLGRENLNILYQLSEYDFYMHFIPDKKVEIQDRDSVLGNIKYQILTITKSKKDNIGLKQDRSLQIMASPNVKREVETTYNSILYNLEHDKNLLLTEIAVLVTDMTRYKPVISSVFSQSPNMIKYNLTSNINNEESAFAQALISIIDLTLGEFSRKNIFDLLRNPCVMKYWDYGFKEIDIWARWVSKLGVFRAFDVKNDSEGLPEAGLYTWKQGLERIRLSRIMSYPSFEIGETRPNFMGLVPLRDLDVENKELVGKFCNIIEVLHDLTVNLAIDRASVNTWLSLILSSIKNFIMVPTNLQLEKRIFKSFVNYLDTLSFYDSFSEYNTSTELGLSTIKTILSSHFSSISDSYGDYLTGGVTVSSLISVRSIPFKIVYLLGLEEGSFPSKAYDSSLDLRDKTRRVGDTSSTESDKYAFLETLISTQKKLYLGYLSKNPKKNRVLQPCSIISQLRRYVEHYVLKNNAEFNVIDIPNKGSDSFYFSSSLGNWSDLLVNYSPSDFISYVNSSFIGNNLDKFLSDIIRKMNPDFSFKKEEQMFRVQNLDEDIKINMSDLKFFLIDPVTAKINLHIGKIRTHAKSILNLEHENEPISTEYSIKFSLERESIENWILATIFDGNNCIDYDLISCEFDMIYDHYMRKSLTPNKAFAQHDKRFIKKQIVTFAEKLLPVIRKMKKSKRIFSDFIFGEPKYNQIIDNRLNKILRHKGLILNIKRLSNNKTYYIPVVLQGSVKWVWEDYDKKWNVLLPIWFKKQEKYSEEYIIEALLFFLAIISNSNEFPSPLYIKFHIVYQDKITEISYLLSSDTAKKYLVWLLEDLFDFSNLVWLPWVDIVSRAERRKFITKSNIKVQDRKKFFEDIKMEFDQKRNNNFILSKAFLPNNILEIAREKFKILLGLTKNK